MADSLGGRGGARRVVDPTGVAGGFGERREAIDVRTGQPKLIADWARRQVDRDDLEALVRGQSAGKAAVVESAPELRHHKEFGRQLAGDEADLVFSQYRNDRVLHRAQSSQRRRDDHGFERRGQLPGHDGSHANSTFGERGSRRAGGVVELPCGQTAAMVVGENPAVRLALCRLGYQRPERLNVRHARDPQPTAEESPSARSTQTARCRRAPYGPGQRPNRSLSRRRCSG